MSSAFKLSRAGVGAAHRAPRTTPLLKAPTPPAYVHARVNGRVRRCLLDSGADVSLIPTQFVPIEKLEPHDLNLRAANDTPIQIDGRVCLTVRIGKQHLPSTLLASPNVDKVILGRDWLQKNRVLWDFGRDRVNINNHPCEIRLKNRKVPRCKQCRVQTDFEIPPSGETVVPVDLVFGHLRPPTDSGHWTTVPAEPAPGLRVARTLITPDSPTVAVRVCNITRHPILLRKGQAEQLAGVLHGLTTPATSHRR